MSADALTLARAGDLKGAVTVGEAALAADEEPGLTFFVGMLCAQLGEVDRAVVHLRRAVELAPAEQRVRVELARALLAASKPAEVIDLVTPVAGTQTPVEREMLRLRAHALSQLGHVNEALSAYSTLCSADTQDFESWTGVGTTRLLLGDVTGAIQALTRATTLAPNANKAWLALANAHVAAGAFESAAAAGRRALAGQADDTMVHLVLARAMAGLERRDEALASIAKVQSSAKPEILIDAGQIAVDLREFGLAEELFREVLASNPFDQAAVNALGKLLERTNRLDELAVLLDESALPGSALGWLRARLLQRRGAFAAALEVAQRIPVDDDAIARSQLIGEIADRLEKVDTAFDAFAESNRLIGIAAADSVDAARRYSVALSRTRALVTSAWYAQWSPPDHGDGRAPLFIFGFPRSGTTLIDTMLAGHPGAALMEEEAVIERTAQAAGAMELLPRLQTTTITRLRNDYWSMVAGIVPEEAGKLIVDKQPLALGSTPILHRLFPGARYLFAERHPCDVVLSCFMNSLRFNAGVSAFYDLVETARFYDRVMSLWQRLTDVFPLAVHRVRYEQLVADPETQLRLITDFAGLSWTPRLLASESNAADRGYIASPSYAQVRQPIYQRAAGRWQRYRRHLDPVLPILAPWAESMGYALD